MCTRNRASVFSYRMWMYCLESAYMSSLKSTPNIRSGEFPLSFYHLASSYIFHFSAFSVDPCLPCLLTHQQQKHEIRKQCLSVTPGGAALSERFAGPLQLSYGDSARQLWGLEPALHQQNHQRRNKAYQEKLLKQDSTRFLHSQRAKILNARGLLLISSSQQTSNSCPTTRISSFFLIGRVEHFVLVSLSEKVG